MTTAYAFRQRDDYRTAVLKEAAQRVGGKEPPDNWREWLTTLLPQHFPNDNFSDHHVAFWEWVDSIQPDKKPRPFVAIWGRGGGKSTNAEAAVVYLLAKKKRKYVWYISETQAQADEHVSNIESMLNSPQLTNCYPKLTERLLGKYGHSKGWRRNRLRCGNGGTVDSLGLDIARRGFKVEEQRPDLILPDDIDSDLDRIEATDKKESTLTKKILPAGAVNSGILAVQNLVTPTGIFSRLNDGTARYLANRIVSGPHPAIIDLKTENVNGRDVIVGGTPTWEGQPLEVCQAQIDEWGLAAFLAECQHEVYSRTGQVFLPEWWDIKGGRNRYSIHDEYIQNATYARWQFWDTALKDKKANDPSMCITIDMDKSYRLYLRDVWQDRIESAYLPEKMRELAAKWNFDKKLQEIIIEDKGSGTTSIQTIRKSAPQWLAEMVQEFTPHGSKDYRARTASMWCPRNCLLFPYPDDSLLWYNDLLDFKRGQLFRFAGEGTVPHDEFIDCISMAILYLEHYISQGWSARIANQQAHPQAKPGGLDSRIKAAYQRAEDEYA